MSRLGSFGAAWGVLGVLALLVSACVRMTPHALAALDAPLAAFHWVFLAGWVVFMAYTEGLRGFHRAFSPRVVARARALAEHPTPLRVALAPLYCMSLFDAEPRRMWISRTLVVGIVLLVVLVRQLDQPWRGLLDAGVIVGLGLGTASVVWHAARALNGAAARR